MHSATWLTGSLAFLALLTTPGASPAASAPRTSAIQAAGQAAGPRALDGTWLYVEDRTEGREVEQQQPSMSTQFTMRVEEDAVIVERSDGDVRIALDGSTSEVAGTSSLTRYRGAFKDGVFEYETEMLRASDGERTGLIRREMRPTAEGLLVRVVVAPPTAFESLALYRHPQDIPLPAPAEAAIDDMAWLAGAWVGETAKSSTEERWGPPLGGAMLGTSRTVSKSKGVMVAFEYLRVVERDGGLVYVAQPNGGTATEFVLTELSGTRAVFDNPRHDSPQRIVYELSEDGRLTASVGFMKGGKPKAFDFEREGG
jgi:hypothetical protein